MSDKGEDRQEDIRSLYRELCLARSFEGGSVAGSDKQGSGLSCACCWLEKLADLLDAPPTLSTPCSFITAQERHCSPIQSATYETNGKGTCASCVELAAQLYSKRPSRKCLEQNTGCSEPLGHKLSRMLDNGAGDSPPAGAEALRICSRLLRSYHHNTSVSRVEYQKDTPTQPNTEKKRLPKRKSNSERRAEAKKKSRSKQNNGRNRNRDKDLKENVTPASPSKKESIGRVIKWLESMTVEPYSVSTDPEVLEHVRKIHELIETKSVSSTQRCCECCPNECTKECDKTAGERVQTDQVEDEEKDVAPCDQTEGEVQKSGELEAEHLWAVTRISVFGDKSRTYEVFRPKNKPPARIPSSADAVFLLLPPQINTPS